MRRHPTRYVLGEELSAHQLSFVPTVADRIPHRLYQHVGVISRVYCDVSHNALAEDSTVDEEVEVEIRYGSGIVRRVGKIDNSLDGNRRWRSVDDREVTDVELQTTDAWNSISSFPASRYCQRQVSKPVG